MQKIQKKLIEIKETQDKRQEKYYSWLKSIITLSVGLFGIIISFKSGKSDSITQLIFFIISISSLALGILSGIIVLYTEVNILDKLRKSQQEYLLKMIDGTTENIEIDWVKRGRFYEIVEIICFFSYTTSLISLIVYSSLNGLKNIC